MTMIQLRQVPESMHRELKARAAREGMSLSDYATLQLRRALEQPPRQQILERLQALEPIEGGEDSASAVRSEREAR